MIVSEYNIVDFGEGTQTKTVPVYTDNSYLRLTSKPDWLQCNYNVGDNIAVTSDLVNLEISPNGGYFSNEIGDSITLEDISGSESLVISVIWTFAPEKVSLSELADEMLIVLEDTPLWNYDRAKILFYLKKSLRWLNFASTGEISRYEAKIDDVKRVFAPIDMIQPLALYCVNDYGKLGRLYRNDKLNKGAYAPILDDDNSIILDDNSYWIEGQGLTAQPTGESKFLESLSYNIDGYYSERTFGRFNKSFQGVQGGRASIYGQYKYVKEEKYFFVDSCPYEDFVIEYISDPILNMQMKKDYGDIRIDKLNAEALFAMTYRDMINKRSDFPMAEKERARRDVTEKRKAAMRMSHDYGAIVQSLKTKRSINKL